MDTDLNELYMTVDANAISFDILAIIPGIIHTPDGSETFGNDIRIMDEIRQTKRFILQ